MRLVISIEINDSDDNITSKVLTFADDPKVCRQFKHYGVKQHLQNDIHKLVKLFEKCQSFLNFGK